MVTTVGARAADLPETVQSDSLAWEMLVEDDAVSVVRPTVYQGRPSYETIARFTSGSWEDAKHAALLIAVPKLAQALRNAADMIEYVIERRGEVVDGLVAELRDARAMLATVASPVADQPKAGPIARVVMAAISEGMDEPAYGRAFAVAEAAGRGHGDGHRFGMAADQSAKIDARTMATWGGALIEAHDRGEADADAKAAGRRQHGRPSFQAYSCFALSWMARAKYDAGFYRQSAAITKTMAGSGNSAR